MNTSSKLLLSILLLPFFSIAQSNYKPGYVINLKGDTLHGFIDLREWGQSPTSIKFKTALDGKVTTFTAGAINNFNVSNIAEYQSYTGPISMDPVNVDRMIEERDTTYKVDTVFLELLQRGKNVALYAYSDRIKTRFFIGEAPNYVPTELVYRLYYDTDNVSDTKGRTVNENTYMKQLFALAQKYNVMTDRLITDIEGADYKEQHIVPIVTRINNISTKKSKKNHK